MFLACLNYISVPDRDFEPIRPFRVQPDTALEDQPPCLAGTGYESCLNKNLDQIGVSLIVGE